MRKLRVWLLISQYKPTVITAVREALWGKTFTHVQTHETLLSLIVQKCYEQLYRKLEPGIMHR